MLCATIAACATSFYGCEHMMQADKLSRFARDGGDAAFTMTVSYADEVSVPVGDVTGSFRRTAWIADDKGGVLFHRKGLFRLDYNADFSCCTLTIRRRVKDSEALHYVYTAQCFAYYLLSQGGCCVHSAALAGVDGAMLLCGASGVGKSTMTTHCLQHDPSLTVLCEDMPAVRRSENGFTVYGTPFCGQDTRCAAGQAPLKAIVLLKQGTQNHFSRPSSAQAFSELMANVPSPIYVPTLREVSVDLAARLCEEQALWVFENDGTAVAAQMLLAKARAEGWL